MATKKILFALMGVLIIMSLTVACGESAEEAAAKAALEAIYAEETRQAAEAAEPVQPVKLEPSLIPGDPPEPERTLEDSDSSIRAYENRAVTGDNFLNGLYERPFTSQEMIYQPDLDINTVDFAYGENFLYFTIRLNGMNPDEWGLNGLYGVEFDRTLTGRGDLIVLVADPAEEWSVENVMAYADENGDVGGPKPIVTDKGFNGSGYDIAVELTDNKAAFARIDPEDPEAVQIAVSWTLLEYPPEFLWGAWADNGLKDIAKFDYNDSMSLDEAGSPIKGEDYPLKALFNLDNTCRLPFGFEQETASYPGMCINVPPKIDRPNCRKVCGGVLEWHCWWVCD
jgi:hypothetical protein